MFGNRTIPSLGYRAYDRAWAQPLLGIDEVGTGAVAGPIYAAGCILPRDPDTLDMLEKLHLQDSKRMSKRSRNRVFDFLTNLPNFRYWIGQKSSDEIEAMGQEKALASMFNEIIAWRLTEIGNQGITIIDGEPNANVTYQVHWIPKADTRSLTVAAAAVLAKVARDERMIALAGQYPEYGFDVHKGYVTVEHQEALAAHGPCAIHRRNTKPVRVAMEARRMQDQVERTVAPGTFSQVWSPAW